MVHSLVSCPVLPKLLPSASLLACGLHLCPPHEPHVVLHPKFINTFPSSLGALVKIGELGSGAV